MRYYRPERLEDGLGGRKHTLPDVIAWLRPGYLISTVDVARYTGTTTEAAEVRLAELATATGRLIGYEGGGFWRRVEPAPPGPAH